MKISELEERFEANEELIDLLDTENAVRPNQSAKKVNVDFPPWMVASLDREAKRVGVTRQSLIKLWLADKLDEIARASSSSSS